MYKRPYHPAAERFYPTISYHPQRRNIISEVSGIDFNSIGALLKLGSYFLGSNHGNGRSGGFPFGLLQGFLGGSPYSGNYGGFNGFNGYNRYNGYNSFPFSGGPGNNLFHGNSGFPRWFW